MSSWVIVLIIVLLAVAAVVYARSRRERSASRDGLTAPLSDRNYAQERETSRVGQMSEEDRAWEASSLQKNRDAQEKAPPPPPTS